MKRSMSIITRLKNFPQTLPGEIFFECLKNNLVGIALKKHFPFNKGDCFRSVFSISHSNCRIGKNAHVRPLSSKRFVAFHSSLCKTRPMLKLHFKQPKHAQLFTR
ncbi:Dynein regulatory complex subunit [Trichinella spiralis]|uniref:Dynein regulatory complex subunit n=1 Tax=Trichinella spiralis TaxID=6334 RepID=A0ABR3KUU1_TRISP